MTLPVRYSPSGSPITNAGGAPLLFGPGARLRLTEAQSIMGGSLAIPAVADVISPDGFGDPDALVLTLSAPREQYQYRAKLSLDITNSSTNVGGEVVLYLDTSVDGGTTYTNRVKCVHLIDSIGTADLEARSADVYLPLILGTSLGVDDTAPTASIKLRARASMPVGSTGLVQVSSLATSDGGTPVTGLNGTIHMELEECL
jgi:hypothetical protein